MAMVDIWLWQNVYLMEFCAGLKLTTVNRWAPMCAHAGIQWGTNVCTSQVKYATYYYSANREECHQVSCTNMMITVSPDVTWARLVTYNPTYR